MKNRVQALIDVWKQRRSVKALMGCDWFFPKDVMDDLHKDMSSMEGSQRAEALKDLKDIEKAVARRLIHLKDSRDLLEEQLDGLNKSKNACLAYHRQGRVASSYVVGNNDLNMSKSTGEENDKA